MRPIDVVFLDFDGVTHPLFPRADRRHGENQFFSYLDNVLNTIDQFLPGAVIVVSSAWRNFDDFLEKTPKKLLDRVAGRNPNINLLYAGVREDESLEWIKRNFADWANIRWMAIDDQTSGWRSHEKLLICEDGFRQLEMDTFAAVIQDLLNAPVTAPSGIIC